MDNRARIAIAALAAVLIVVAFVVANGSDDSDKPAATDTTAQTASTPSADTDTTTTPTTPTVTTPAPEIPTIATVDGKPVDDVQRLTFKQGDKVRFRVTSNVAEVVHVHGYDLEKEIPAGGSATFSFDASIEGIFDIELHHSGQQIGELEVNPS